MRCMDPKFYVQFHGCLLKFHTNFEPIHYKGYIVRGIKCLTTFDILELWHLKSYWDGPQCLRVACAEKAITNTLARWGRNSMVDICRRHFNMHSVELTHNNNNDNNNKTSSWQATFLKVFSPKEIFAFLLNVFLVRSATHRSWYIEWLRAALAVFYQLYQYLWSSVTNVIVCRHLRVRRWELFHPSSHCLWPAPPSEH